jgi:hypothetical protein
MNEAFRLSRIRAPRANLASAVLVATVLVVFGLAMTALAPEQAATAGGSFDGTEFQLAHWLLSGEAS